MKSWIVSYFELSKKEFNGVVVLLLLMTIVYAFPYLYAYFQKEQVLDSTAFQKEVAAFKASAIANRSYSYKNYSNRYKTYAKVKPEYFKFNPNGLAAGEWQRLG